MDQLAQNNHLNTLCASLDASKIVENLAKQYRIDIAQTIIDAFGVLKDEGANSKTLADYKITITKKSALTVDWDLLNELVEKNNLNTELNIKIMKPTIDISKYKYLRTYQPSTFKLLAPAITETPNKTAVTLSVNE